MAFAGGDVEASEAWRRIHSDDEYERMPPEELGKSLTDEDIDVIRAWMAEGAPWAGHWSFSRLQRPEAPASGEAGRNPIDAFVDKRLKAEGVTPNGPASRETLARRVSLHLTGLPLPPERRGEFLADTSREAWSDLVDDLLASPAYAERMAVDWLDGARYADTNGYQNDFKREMWPWRDWVIEAFARNQPFDKFTVEQIAGDLLSEPSREQLVATAFNRNHRTVTEAGSLSEEWLVENVVDRVETTGAVFLGLTLGCARCHDHKYDPVSQRDFFSFFAFFHNVNELGVNTERRGNVEPLLYLLGDEQEAAHDELIVQAEAARELVKKARERARLEAIAWRPAGAQDEVRSAAAVAQVPLSGELLASVRGEHVAPTSAPSKAPSSVKTPFGQAAKFDGLSWLDYPELVSVGVDRAITVSCWVRPEGHGAVFSSLDGADAKQGIEVLLENDRRVTFRLVVGEEDLLEVTSKQAVPHRAWTQIAASYDGSGKAAGVALTINGVSVEVEAKHEGVEGSFEAPEVFRVGRGSRGPMFNGHLRDLRFYEATLPEDAVRAMTLADAGLALERARQSGDEDTLAEVALPLYTSLADEEAAVELRRASAQAKEADAALAGFRADKQTLMIMEELPTPRETFVLRRGEYDKPDPEQPVTAALPDFLGEVPSSERTDRLALARWLVSRENPLTSRVVANRLWRQFFGVGLVKTTDDFGVQGERPSHPELLDWLAAELMDSGWDLQHLIRLIVGSETYQRSSALTAEQHARDPENRLLGRGPRKRLQAEFVRDNALAVSGLLDRRVGGPSVFPYQPDGLWKELAGGAGQGPYVLSEGADLYRRSLYTYRKRTVPHPTMATFDAPSFEVCSVYRATTNTPLQSLALLNDTTYVEAARALGERMLDEGGPTPEGRLRYGFALATGREPNEDEAAVLTRALERYQGSFANDDANAAAYLSVGDSDVDARFDTNELAAYAAVGSLLLNLDETITVE